MKEQAIEKRELAELWSQFEDGDISPNEMGKKVKALCEHEPIPQPDIKHHWPGRYDPEADEEYCSVGWRGIDQQINNNQDYNNSERARGICCKTEAEAEFVRSQQAAYLELIDLIRELNEGWTPDFTKERERSFIFIMTMQDQALIAPQSTPIKVLSQSCT